MWKVWWQRDFDKGPWSCWTLRSSHLELLQGCPNVCVQSKQGRANNVVCRFCGATVTGCSSTQVYADIVGRKVVGQKIWERRKLTLRLIYQYAGKMTIEMHYSKLLLGNFWQRHNDCGIKAQFVKSQSQSFGFKISSKQNCDWRTKNVESTTVTPDFPIAIFIYENRLLLDVANSQFHSFGWPMHWILSTASGEQIQSTESMELVTVGGQLLDTAHEDTAVLVQLIMDRL